MQLAIAKQHPQSWRIIFLEVDLYLDFAIQQIKLRAISWQSIPQKMLAYT